MPQASQVDMERTPEFSEGQLAWLEAQYPPRCYMPGTETLENHLLYAGCATLVQRLRQGQQARVAGDDPDGLSDEEMAFLNGRHR